MGNNFAVGDFITINSPTHPLFHGKKGTIRQLTNGGYITSVIDDKGKSVLIELAANQMIKVIKEPGLMKLLGETLPELTKQAATEYNAQQDKVVDEANRDIKVFKAGMQDGYFQGFNEGYVIGYQAACADVQELFKKHGLIMPKPGEPDADLNV